MLKRAAALAICLALMITVSASAERAPSNSMFSTAKSALSLLAQGDTQGAIDRIGFSYQSSAYSDEDFGQFVQRYLPGVAGSAVQTDVAVCYWESVSSHWLFAVPVTEPKSGDVMCFVLMSSDLNTFDGYAALTWSEVTDGTSQSTWVWWNVEYSQGSGSLYAD